MFFVLSSFVLSIHASAEDVRIEEAFVGYSLLHGDLQNKASGWEFSAGKTSRNGLAFTRILMLIINLLLVASDMNTTFSWTTALSPH